jgi:hypothetical protein
MRAFAALGLFLGALVVQSLYHFDRPPVQGLVLQNTFIERCSLPVSEDLSRLNTEHATMHTVSISLETLTITWRARP